MTKKEREEQRRENSRLQREAYRQQLFEQNKENWTKRVLLVVAESSKAMVADNYEGFNIEYHVRYGVNRDNYFSDHGYLPVNLQLTDNIEEVVMQLETFESRIENIIKEREEQERKERLRREALAKLTEEERNALGV